MCLCMKYLLTYPDCCLFISILLHIFNAFSAPCCNAFILFKALWIVFFFTWNVLQINLTLTLKAEVSNTFVSSRVNLGEVRSVQDLLSRREHLNRLTTVGQIKAKLPRRGRLGFYRTPRRDLAGFLHHVKPRTRSRLNPCRRLENSKCVTTLTAATNCRVPAGRHQNCHTAGRNTSVSTGGGPCFVSLGVEVFLRLILRQ